MRLRVSAASMLLLFACSSSPSTQTPRSEVQRAAVFSGSGTLAALATIYADGVTENGGIYNDFCVGNQASLTSTRRAFIRYSLPSIPSTATVTRVVLTMTQELVRNTGGPLPATLDVRRATSAWTRGAGGGNTRSCGGGTVVAGVNWSVQPSVPSVLSATAALPIAEPHVVTFDSDVGTDNDGLINDVQAWVSGTPNNGWRLTVAQEGTPNNARSIRPGTLTVYWATANGSTCAADNDCASGNCVHPDGLDCGGRAGCVCCSAATCAAECQTCFRAGQVGTCAPRPNTTVCRAASCTGGTATQQTTCTGTSATCPAPSLVTCSPYFCSGTACASTCTTPGACATGFFCNATSQCEAYGDECAQGLDDCAPLAACADPSAAPGNFVCTCPAGYIGDGRTGGTSCTELDECALGTDDCSAQASCTNLPGTWACACLPGYAGTGQLCSDVDECAADGGVCHLNANCTNTPGSFSCACKPFWSGDGGTCVDIDECAADAGTCPATELCVNRTGEPSRCDCVAGQTRSDAGVTCAVRCGDGVRGSAEGCDDANLDPGDGCSAGCAVEPGWTCGDPIDGGASACSSTCGNGVTESPEECDDGSANSDTAADACRRNCRRARCGDGVVDSAEGCDDGASRSDTTPDACRTRCARAWCGDGVIDTAELCDPGGVAPGAAAPGLCTTVCSAADAGMTPGDGGTTMTDGGFEPPDTSPSCGCQVGSAGAWAWAVLFALLRRRARR